MKLEYEEAANYMSQFDTDRVNIGDDLDRLYKLKYIMKKYTEDVDLDMVAVYDQVFLYSFPDDGMEEEDLETISKLGFFLDEDSIAMFT